jgi:Xaa-Pro aminopeptidase
LLNLLPQHALVVLSGKQGGHFVYLSNVHVQDVYLLLGTHTPSTLYYTDASSHDIQWHGHHFGVSDAYRAGFTNVYLSSIFWETLREMLSSYVLVYSVKDTPFWHELQSFCARHHANVRVHDVTPVVSSMRLIKDDVEISLLKKACRVSLEAHRHVQHMFLHDRQDVSECTIASHFTTYLAHHDMAVAYPSIVAFDQHACVLHHHPTYQRATETSSMLVDAGGVCHGYAADISRTITRHQTSDWLLVYHLVRYVYDHVVASVCPGVTWGHLNKLAHQLFKQRFSELGIPWLPEFFPHSIGHWIGLDVHDVGDRNTPFLPGMTFTIEPGLYIPEYIQDVPWLNENIGVRFENVLLVTETGCVSLVPDDACLTL